MNSVGAQFILGSWYKKSELGIRAAVFCVFGHVGSMAGGWIQAGLLQTLAGKGGLPAWKWIFIIVSVMTVPVALFGMFSSNYPPRRDAELTGGDLKAGFSSLIYQYTVPHGISLSSKKNMQSLGWVLRARNPGI